MSYADAIQFLYGLRWFGAKFGLTNTFKLAALAGDPQSRLRFIHVAGTNGKGSTCAMLESIYRAAGLRVGLFTSPHLVSFSERIQVNRQNIPDAEVVRLLVYIEMSHVSASIIDIGTDGQQFLGFTDLELRVLYDDACACALELARVGELVVVGRGRQRDEDRCDADLA